MSKERYCEPWCAGLDSEPRAVGRRIGRLLDALDGEVTRHVAKGLMVAEVENLRWRIMDRLKADGWRITVNARDRWQVLPPKGGAS